MNPAVRALLNRALRDGFEVVHLQLLAAGRLQVFPATFSLIEIARAQKKDDALAGLERWRARHPEAAAHLQPADVLVDAMRGRYHTWTRIRINLQHVPDALRPPQEALDPDETLTW